MNTSYPTETELSSVNSILIAIGQAPVTRLYLRDEEDRVIHYTHEEEMCGKTLTFTGEQNLGDSLKLMQYVNPEVAMIHNILMLSLIHI